jgi:hypothetical protein
MVAPIDWGQDTCYADTAGAAMDAAQVALRRINGGANRLGPGYMLRQHCWRRDGCGASSVAAPVALRRINGGANRLGPSYMLQQHYWRRDGCGASSVAPRQKRGCGVSKINKKGDVLRANRCASLTFIHLAYSLGCTRRKRKKISYKLGAQ